MELVGKLQNIDTNSDKESVVSESSVENLQSESQVENLESGDVVLRDEMTPGNRTSKSREADKACKGKKNKKRVKLIRHDYEAVVAYIEDPEYFCEVMGGGRKTKVGGKYTSKAKAFQIMASHLKIQRGKGLQRHREQRRRARSRSYENRTSRGRGECAVSMKRLDAVRERV
ncbi:hypothetical protein R1sor_000348 [Riccia sorocarpa]|uniref:Uncharacterized protein n=1 Tax=Riccia sorocarpa TaxID=122646 RepID=A0ABD3GUI9_9MARC